MVPLDILVLDILISIYENIVVGPNFFSYSILLYGSTFLLVQPFSKYQKPPHHEEAFDISVRYGSIATSQCYFCFLGFWHFGIAVRFASEDFFEFPHLGAVGAFEEDGGVGEGVLREVGFGVVGGGEPEESGCVGDMGGELELGSYEDNQREVGGQEALDDGFVLLAAVGAELSHVAEHGHLVVALEGFEVVEGHLHAGGVGVVAVEEEDVAGGLLVLRALVGGLVLLDGLFDVPKLDAEVTAHGGGGHGVVEVVVAEELRLDRIHIVALLDIELHVGVGADEMTACGIEN